jgi:hypothetical protein
MPRNCTTTVLDALLAPLIRPALFVQATFANETIYVWSGRGNIEWNGQTWIGTGSLLNISTVEESSTVEAKGISISLSGIDNTLLQECMSEFQVSLPVYVYFGLFDANNNLLPNPILSFAGRTDQPTVDMDVQTSTITIACESLLLDMNVPVPYRFDAPTQLIFFPNDLAFSFVNSIQNIPIYWNTQVNSNGNP